MKKKLFSLISFVSFVLSLYSLGGVLQALSLFRGERALHNYYLWGTAFLVSLVAALIFRLLAARPNQSKNRGRCNFIHLL